MKLLDEILDAIRIPYSESSSDLNVEGIAIDSRKVKDNFLFITYRGNRDDGHKYIDAAIKNGAKYIICEDDSYVKENSNVLYFLVDNARQLVSEAAACFYGYPSQEIKLVGVTGTNGKTTTVNLLFDLFEKLGYKCGLLSTIENKIGNEVLPSELTTPDPVTMQQLFRAMKGADVTHAFMEVSSHALDQGRVNAVEFDLAIFTNITHDHLDYHETFKAYIEAKRRLFDNLSEYATALINIDDVNGKVMVQSTKADVKSYAIKRPADFKCKIVENGINGLHLEINKQEVFLKLAGRFNAYNATAVYAAGVLLEEDPTDVLVALSLLNTAEGRMEILESEVRKYKAVVDYAHTPDALKKILESLNEMLIDKAKIITVVGCGGDRDRSKRPLMAEIAASLSSKCIFTSDNPRNEPPEAIIAEMQEGLSEGQKNKCVSITDRKEAIRMALMLADENDIVLVAGKGHEKYQEIKGQRFPFDDKEIIRAVMQREDI